ncbi:hypothetical protein BC936DRAFT_144850 [Jimgerdemannia flammicorona]|uniref:Uncharacterized protein n=1 Tax=Jimgerdemannia flammicorona TaxID=994334 RepID=A0A433DBI6_9FUNG|nr:hypothetical protein BC936DRAFT_144850 [Jimgerdemannia flammicorona]
MCNINLCQSGQTNNAQPKNEGLQHPLPLRPHSLTPTATARPTHLSPVPETNVTLGPMGVIGTTINARSKFTRIYYGNWSPPKTCLPILSTISPSSAYFNIEKEYYHIRQKQYVRGYISYSDNYSQGKNLTQNAIHNVVSSAIQRNTLPSNPNVIYVVYTSPDVTHNGFCSRMCGYHSYYKANQSTTRTKRTLTGARGVWKFQDRQEWCEVECQTWEEELPPARKP